jgi:uncharacterized protein
VIVKVPDLSEEIRRLEYTESAAVLNEMLAAGSGGSEQRFGDDLEVDVEIHRDGTDVHLAGTITGRVLCTCGRCLDEFLWPLTRSFRFLIVKARPGEPAEDDTGLDHYYGDQIDLGPLLREQALLSLERTVLCSTDCKGLCPQCGVNRNRETCDCAASASRSK